MKIYRIYDPNTKYILYVTFQKEKAEEKYVQEKELNDSLLLQSAWVNNWITLEDQ